MDRTANAAWELFASLPQIERAKFARLVREWEAERQADRRARVRGPRGPTPLLSELSVSEADLSLGL